MDKVKPADVFELIGEVNRLRAELQKERALRSVEALRKASTSLSTRWAVVAEAIRARGGSI